MPIRGRFYPNYVGILVQAVTIWGNNNHVPHTPNNPNLPIADFPPLAVASRRRPPGYDSTAEIRGGARVQQRAAAHIRLFVTKWHPPLPRDI